MELQVGSMTTKSCDEEAELEDGAFECLKGYEQELEGLLNFLSRPEQDSSTGTHFDCQDFEDELNPLPVPDLMSEGISSWTEFLLDDFPGNKILPFPSSDSTQMPCDFLAISLGPQESSNVLQPSFPASMFTNPFDESAELNDDSQLRGQQGCQSVQNETAHEPFRSLISQASSTSIGEIAQQELSVLLNPPETQGNVSFTVHNQGDEVQPPSYSNPLNSNFDTQNSAQTQPGQQDSTLPDPGQTPGKAKKGGQKRKRVSKPKDPNAPKRKVGRPKATPGLNFLKHIKAFQQDGGFTLGEQAKLLTTGEPTDVQLVAQSLEITATAT